MACYDQKMAEGELQLISSLLQSYETHHVAPSNQETWMIMLIIIIIMMISNQIIKHSNKHEEAMVTLIWVQNHEKQFI